MKWKEKNERKKKNNEDVKRKNRKYRTRSFEGLIEISWKCCVLDAKVGRGPSDWLGFCGPQIENSNFAGEFSTWARILFGLEISPYVGKDLRIRCIYTVGRRTLMTAKTLSPNHRSQTDDAQSPRSRNGNRSRQWRIGIRSQHKTERPGSFYSVERHSPTLRSHARLIRLFFF